MNHPQDLFLIGVETDVLNIIITVKSVDFQSDCCEHKLLIPGELEHELHCDLFSVLASFILFQLHFLTCFNVSVLDVFLLVFVCILKANITFLFM